MPALAPQLFHIRTKDRAIQKMTPRPLQLHYQANRARQELILKARQGGVSTWKELEGLLLMLSIEGFSGAIVSHEKGATKRLFNMIWLAYSMLPADYKVPLYTESKDEFATPPPPEGTGSRLYIGTAGPNVRAFGRGDTVHWFHGSEVSRWSDKEELLLGVQEAVPDRGFICLETTANGREEYYDLYQAAPGNGYKRHFYPWWWIPEYREEAAGFVPTEEELDLIETAARQGFQLEYEQLQWRRRKVARTKRFFQQEYPEDEVTCFLVSGNPRFEMEFVARLVGMAQARPLLRCEDKPYGELRMWLDPGVGHTYVVGADPARGLAHGDFCAAAVLDCENGQHVASLHGKQSPHIFAQELANLGGRYNDALLTVERNGPGEAVLEALMTIGYDNIYSERRWYDDQDTEIPGFYTERKSKHRLCSEFDRALSCGDFKTWDMDLLDQCMNVMVDERGDPYTAKNKRDDLLMAAMLANMTAEHAHPAVAVGGNFAKSYFGA